MFGKWTGTMSKAKFSMKPNENGQFRSWCYPCDVEGDFPTLEMAMQATKLHLCVGEVASCAWEGWTTEIGEWKPSYGDWR
jgi:hypothetical protein